MAYNVKYFFDFTSAPADSGECTDYRVNFSKREDAADSSTPIELQGGPAPFVLSLGNDNDPLAVTRTSSAQISFFDDIELSILLPADATEWQVTLTRTSDNKRVFIGYLTAEVYTQPAIDGPNVITVNAASPLVPILAESLSVADMGVVTIGGLIRNAIAEVEGISTVYMPAIYTTEYPMKSAQYSDILRYRLSQAMYVHPSDTAAITGVQYESDTYAEPLEALCRLFGWSMVDVGDNSLYFILPGHKGKYMQLSLDDLVAESAFTPTLVSPAISRESDIEPMDSGDTVELQQGVGSAMLEVKATDIEIETPNPEDYITSQVYSRRSADYTYYDAPDAKVEIAKISTTLQHPNITMYNYRLSPTLDSNKNVIENWEIVSGTISSDCAGADFNKFDWSNPDKLIFTADDRKTSWAFTPAFRIEEVASAEVPGLTGAGSYIARTVPASLPLMVLKFGVASFTGGALCVSLKALAQAAEGFYIPTDGTVAGGTIDTPTTTPYPGLDRTFWSDYNKVIGCSLRVGSHFWTGTRWTMDKSIFYLPLSTTEAEWHPLVSNKSVDMLYEDGEGVYIPITTPISGEVEMQIYRTEVIRVGEYLSGYNGTYHIKDLSLTYKSSLELVIPTINSTTYYRSFGKRFTEKKEVTLPLHSRINGAEQLSLIYKDATTPLDKLYKVTHSAAAKPEQFLLDEYERIYARPLQRWRRGMMLRELRPIDIFSRSTSDSVLAITGYTADFDANTIVTYLSDVKTLNTIYYVE